MNIDESIEIECTIEYEYLKYNYSKPKINLIFYLKENNSFYIPIDEIYLNKIEDIEIEKNHWKHSIIYQIKSINNHQQEYICMIIPDYFENEDLFQHSNRICRTIINIQSRIFLFFSRSFFKNKLFYLDNQSSIMIFSRLNHIIIDSLIIILISFSILLFLISLILCFITRKHYKKRTIQIKPDSMYFTSRDLLLL